MANSFYDFRQALVDIRSGLVDIKWQDWLRIIFAQADATATAVAAIPGVNNKTIAQLNALGLGAGDANYLAGVTDGFNHLVRWDGAAWQWAPGDGGAGYFGDFAIAPDTNQWALCNGAATTYLSGIGTVTLAATAFTTPNLTGGAYRKGGAAYSGAVNAATAPGVTMGGQTADESAHTHSVPNAHTHNYGGLTSTPNNTQGAQAGGSFQAADSTHQHNTAGTTGNGSAAETSGAGSAHHHAATGLTATADTGGQPANLAALPYIRR